MPTVPILTDGLANAFDFELSKARSLSRYLREADLLTTGARGVNAPSATTRDAARLLIVMMLNSKLPFVVEDLRLVGQFVVLNPNDMPANFRPDTLEEGLSMLIAYAASAAKRGASTVEKIEFRLRPYRALAQITIKHPKRKLIQLNFVHPDLLDWDASTDVPESYVEASKRFAIGFYQEPMMTERELISVGNLVMGAEQ